MPIHPLGERKYFSPNRDAMPLPDLTQLQKDSYKWFFDEGIRELFEEVNPISDYIGRNLELYMMDYYLDEPKFDEATARDRNITYEAPLRVKVKLVNKKTGEIKEQEIYLGDFPLMTNKGTFIVNGVERVVVSQLIRSAGAFFTSNLYRGKKLYGAKIIPNRGAWLEIETESNNGIFVKIDRKRKVAVTALLRAFGYSTDQDILSLFSDIDEPAIKKYLETTLSKDTSKNEEDGLIEVYKRIRPGDLATAENAKSLIHAMFFNFDRYDFGPVGRYKLNKRFDTNYPIDKTNRVLLVDDLVRIIKEIIRLNVTQDDADDIDHLGNRRIRAIGELIQNKFRIGLARMERIIRDRMSTLDIHTLTPNQLINARPVIGTIKEFFMSSQLSQFMDQINPLSELEHKRRLSAMGPGGLSRERAGFEVRDVHRTHYGRICPIATPEGPNIGLVGQLASYARVNKYGFIETPYRKVIRNPKNNTADAIGYTLREDLIDTDSGKIVAKKGTNIDEKLAKNLAAYENIKTIPVIPVITNEIEYIDAFIEERSTSTAATTKVDENGHFINEFAEVRKNGRPSFERVETIDYVDVSSYQIISISTALIPFIENDDAVRALMGTNMQRQGVSVIKPQTPIIGTGIERKAALDSGQAIAAKEDSEVVKVQSNLIQTKTKDGHTHDYPLNKFMRSNAGTSINQKPIVNVGDKVVAGEAIADGASTEHGELALGQNILVAYMTWDGGNYEDAILISERVVEQDRYTSVHIENYSIDIRDTKLGPELITKDIPNVGEEKLKDLDEEGIIRIGAQVSSGDILVGKITPKGETELSAEEKLLRAIFGEKAKDVRDTSLYLEHGEHGKVINIKIFSRKNGDKLPAGVIRSVQVTIAQLRKIQVGDKMAGRHGNKGVISRIIPVEDMPFLEDGTPVDIVLNPLGVISRMNLGQLMETHLGLAAKKLGYRVATPALNGVKAEQIAEELKKAGYPEDGKLQLFDGRNGQPFDKKTTVGITYMLKLNHLVEDKIHQRSIGPYSLVTQQPLGGKAQFGGQRFGEMEVWALEAYGAAHMLQEILTIKSDDVPGRSKAYEAIIKGEPIDKVNIPESFNVLVRELKGLGLDVDLMKNKKSANDVKVEEKDEAEETEDKQKEDKE
ncbi:DNA-directed RNA polymerase subunit beta [Patescibacteria group bacterium]|nr:DNA-directed RNA polymerase subunit beta [Patescibacteria group bacterium]